jgi:predicted nucleic-acid-binding protein
MLSGMLVEVDNELWFLDKTKLEKYIKKSTHFADYSLQDYVDSINKHFPNTDIKRNLSYKDIISNRGVILAKYGFNKYSPSIDSMKKFKKNIVGNPNIPVEFSVPREETDIQIAKELLTLSYISLEPINRKLKWASPTSDNDILSSSSYISCKYHPLKNKNGFDIKLKCAINNIPETKAIAIQVYDILKNSETHFELSKQFVNYINVNTKPTMSRKSFVFYIKTFDILNDLFFLFNRKDIVIEHIDFYQNSDTSGFSDYIKKFCEL